ncbi:hypothetical protein DOY81_003854, partial [Sarcophaga bullata]
ICCPNTKALFHRPLRIRIKLKLPLPLKLVKHSSKLPNKFLLSF